MTLRHSLRDWVGGYFGGSRVPSGHGAFVRKFLCLFWVVAIGGCGYQLVGKETHVPPGLSSIAIPTFVNRTLEPRIEVPFTQAFLREFILDRRVRVVDRKEADSVLEGTLKAFNVISVSYDRSGFVTEYQAVVVADFTLKKQGGEVLWMEKNMNESRWYRVSSSVLITEDTKDVALRLAGQAMAQRIRNRFFYDF